MSIKHNVYEDGKVQSLGFSTEDGHDVTVGVLEEGSYNFGVAERREEIKVLTGELSTPDGKSSWDSMTDPLVFEKGQTIEFNAAVVTSYLCYYG